MPLLVKNLKVRYSGDRMEEYVILVDQNDNPVGKEDKIKCHLPNGKLHRAFSALIFNGEGKLLLTKRSEGKMLWPGDWDGTVASHPRENESYSMAAQYRIPQELGLECDYYISYLNKFEYHVPYKDIGSENEICGTLIGTIDSFDKSSLIKDEISEIKWINPDELKNELGQNKDVYCPWMVIALYFLAETDERTSFTTIERYKSLIAKWTTLDLKRVYENAIKHYIPDNNWRLVPW